MASLSQASMLASGRAGKHIPLRLLIITAVSHVRHARTSLRKSFTPCAWRTQQATLPPGAIVWA